MPSASRVKGATEQLVHDWAIGFADTGPDTSPWAPIRELAGVSGRGRRPSAPVAPLRYDPATGPRPLEVLPEMVKYAWIFGRVMVTVEYFEQIGPDEIEGGARLEVRRVEKELIPGAPAAVSGFRVLPVTDGIWRADLFHLLNKPGDRAIYHYHPNFHDGDVGERQFDPGLTGDHLRWALAQVRNLKGVLRTAGYGELAADVDDDDLRAILPQVNDALERCDGGRTRLGRRLLTADGEATARAERLADPV